MCCPVWGYDVIKIRTWLPDDPTTSPRFVELRWPSASRNRYESFVLCGFWSWIEGGPIMEVYPCSLGRCWTTGFIGSTVLSGRECVWILPT